MIKKPIKINKKKVAFFRFKKNDDGYLIVNDTGAYSNLTEKEFNDFIAGKLDEKGSKYNELVRKFFIKDNFSVAKCAEAYKNKCHYLFDGPSLHIIVATLRCNYKCVYCQANRRDVSQEQFDMTKETAKKIVDRIFESPNKAITIEFQGGEPLLNWPIVKFVVEYAQEKNKKSEKNLRFTLVTNLSLMTDEIYDFFVKNQVSLCTSLDGYEEIHNKNRPCPNLNSYKATTDWIKRIRKKEEAMNIAIKNNDDKSRLYSAYKLYRLSALLTVTNESLKNIRKIIDEYAKYNFNVIHVRQLSFLGYSGGDAKNIIGYTADEFIDCWKDAMEYIIDMNLNGKIFAERGALILLQKMITDRDPGFLDLRSPCGAGIGQIAYNYDGNVYTCDEARTLENDAFLLGNVDKKFQEIISSSKTKVAVIASTLDNLACDECVYKPYCGVCPVINYALYGTVFPQINCTDKCKINKAMLDFLFEKLKDDDARGVFNMWMKRFT